MMGFAVVCSQLSVSSFQYYCPVNNIFDPQKKDERTCPLSLALLQQAVITKAISFAIQPTHPVTIIYSMMDIEYIYIDIYVHIYI